MSIERTPNEWSKESLFAKAQRYFDEMSNCEAGTWQYGFWSALALEMLVRAALASISPALVADGRDWNNILFAVGQQPTAKKFRPKSADISALLVNAEGIFPAFTDEMLGFALAHMSNRNSDLHSGALPFDDVGTSSWLPMFYTVCKCLLGTMGESLESVLDAATAKEAESHIQAGKDDAAKAVMKTISAHATIWSKFTPDEKKERESRAVLGSSKHRGHRVSCPACGCVALVYGSAVGTAKRRIDEGCIVETQRMIPTTFECIACELRITGYSKLVACDRGDAFVSEMYYDPVDFFGIDIADEFNRLMGEDNNEPY